MADYTLSAKITGDSKGFQNAVKDAQSSVEALSSKVQGIGDNVQAFGAKMQKSGALMTAGITMPVAKGISVMVDFDTEMRKAAVIAGAFGEDATASFEDMSAAALHLGQTTTLSSGQVAVAMKELAAAGFDAAQVIEAMPGIISAAEASGEDLALTADTVTAALSGFGLEASESAHIADVLAVSANESKAGIADMGYAFSYAAPAFKALGYSVEDLAAATGILSNAGLDGSRSGTTLRMAIQSLVNPTKDSAALMDALGFSAINADGSMKPLAQIIDELNSSMGDYTDAQRQAALATLFGTQASSGMNVLLAAGGEELRSFTTELQNSTGASEEAATLMKDGVGGSITTLKGAIESAVISLMDNLKPALSSAAETITGLVHKFNSLPEPIKQGIAQAVLFAAVLGPILLLGGTMISLIGKGINAVSFLIKVAGKMPALMTKIGKVFQFLSANPMMAVIGVIAILVTAFITLWNTNENFRKKVIEIWDSIKTKIGNVVQAISDFFTKTIPSAFTTFIDGIVTMFESFVATVNGVWQSIVDFFIVTIPAWIDSVIEWFQQLPYRIGFAIGALFGHIVQFGINAWAWVTTELPLIVTGIVDWFAQLPERIWTWLSGVVDKVVQWGIDTYNEATEAAKRVFNSVVDWFAQLPGRVWTWLSETVTKVVNWGKDLVTKGKNAAINLVTTIVTTIETLPDKMKQIGKNIVKGIWNGITGMGKWLLDQIKGFANGIIDGFKSAFKIKSPAKALTDEVGKFLPPGISVGFEIALPKAIRDMKLAASKIPSKVMSVIDFEQQSEYNSISPFDKKSLSYELLGQYSDNTGYQATSNSSDYYEGDVYIQIERVEMTDDYNIDDFSHDLAIKTQRERRALSYA